MDKVLQIYNLFRKEKKKERFDIILEPLQAVTQLALLSFCPKGSKLTISNNLLSIQEPGWGQGLWRSYNQDGKEDLFFLFNAIVRFNRFYSFIKEESEEFCDLFDLLIQLGKRGIDKLLQTYSNTEQPALLHTLQLYRNLLDKPSMFTEAEETVVNKMDSGGLSNNIDDVFLGIRKLYVSHEYILLYQTLLMLEKNPDRHEIYISGINILLSPAHEKIQKWIVDNIVY
jgi:hypothetical protein